MQQQVEKDTKVDLPEHSTTVRLVHQKHTLKQALPLLSLSPVHIPSTPTVMFYKYPNTSEVDSQRSINPSQYKG